MVLACLWNGTSVTPAAHQDHAQYALTYGMMLGIRVTVREICLHAVLLRLIELRVTDWAT